MKFSIKDFFSKCDQILRKLRIWSHVLKKSLMKNFIFCTVYISLTTFFLLLNFDLLIQGSLDMLVPSLQLNSMYCILKFENYLDRLHCVKYAGIIRVFSDPYFPV